MATFTSVEADVSAPATVMGTSSPPVLDNSFGTLDAAYNFGGADLNRDGIPFTAVTSGANAGTDGPNTLPVAIAPFAVDMSGNQRGLNDDSIGPDPLFETEIYTNGSLAQGALTQELTISGLDPSRTYKFQFIHGDTRTRSFSEFDDKMVTFEDSEGNGAATQLTFGNFGNAAGKPYAVIEVMASGTTSLTYSMRSREGRGPSMSALAIHSVSKLLFKPRQPGSALVYPLFDVNNDAGNARSTTIKLSNLGPGKVWVHLVRVCAGIKSFGGKGLCQASNRQVELTSGETFVRDVAGFFSVDRDNCPTGYIVAYAQMGENDKQPMVWDHLIGSVHMNSAGSLNQRTSGMQAYGFQAAAGDIWVGDGLQMMSHAAPVAGSQGGAQPVLPFDGMGYAAPATTYSTDYLASIGQRYTELTLLTLDIAAGFQNTPTVVALDAWNQKEEYHSGAIEYVCHVRVRLDDELNAAQPGAGVQGGMGFGKASNLGSSYGLLQMTPLTEDHAILGATVEMGGNRQTLRGLWHDDVARPTTFKAR